MQFLCPTDAIIRNTTFLNRKKYCSLSCPKKLCLSNHGFVEQKAYKAQCQGVFVTVEPFQQHGLLFPLSSWFEIFRLTFIVFLISMYNSLMYLCLYLFMELSFYNLCHCLPFLLLTLIRNILSQCSIKLHFRFWSYDHKSDPSNASTIILTT